jgi:hypothetical protein
MTYSIYEVFETETGQEIKQTNADGKVWWIPEDPANADYQEYLRSLEV